MPIQLTDFQSKETRICLFVGSKVTFLIAFVEIGLGLSIFGVGFILLGMMFLFDKGLLAVGNVSVPSIVGGIRRHLHVQLKILFLAGLSMIIGFERTFRFFFQRQKIKATLLFFGGISCVLLGWPVTGMIVESYGFFLLFGSVQRRIQ